MALYWLVLNVGINFFPGTPLDGNSWPPILDAAGLLTLLVIAIAAQAWRYRQVSGPVERQQSKGFAFGLTAALTGFVGLNLLLVLGQPPGADQSSVRIVLGDLAFLCVPLSLGVAILKYRLFDIDVILNRALVYGALTAGVVGLYVLVVGVLGALFRAEGNLLVSLAAAGLIAVLFQPLREHLQRGATACCTASATSPTPSSRASGNAWVECWRPTRSCRPSPARWPRL